jgi:PAS domain S-box-containing protein
MIKPGQEIPAQPKHQNFKKGSLLPIKTLAGYARFLLKNKLNQLAERQYLMVKESNLFFYRYVESTVPEKELLETGLQSIKRFLQSLADNQVDEFIDETIKTWHANQIPFISKGQISPADIARLSSIRRRLFLEWLPDYSQDPGICMAVMMELDALLVELDSVILDDLFHESNKLFVQAQSIGKIGNWNMDIESRKLNWSEELYKIYELDPASELPDDLAVFNHPDDYQLVKDLVQDAIKNREPMDFYYRILVPSGKLKYLHARGNCQFDESDKPISYMGTVQDVTQEKLVETELAASQIFNRKVTDLTPSVIVVYNIQTGKYVYVNRGFKTILGYDPGILMEKGVEFFLDIIHPDDLQDLMEKNKRALEFANSDGQLSNDEIIVDFKYRIRHQQGHYLWFKTHGTVFSRNKEFQVEEVLNISFDITEQENNIIRLNQQNLELAKNEVRYHKMSELVEDYAIILLNRDGYIENWNRGAEKIKGYKPEEIIGKHFSIFYTAQDQKSGLPEKLIQEAVTKGKATHEGWRARKNGDVFWGYIVITTLRDDNNEIFGFTKVTRDLTEKRAMDLKLQRFADNLQLKNRALEQMNKELESFNYVASHDLQEPLRKIKTFTNFILSNDKEKFSAASQDYFNRILSATDRMQNLIEALLQLSRISSIKPEFEETDLNLILEETKRDLQDVIAKKNATIESGVLPTVQANPLQMQQVFYNILANSLKYTISGKPVHIRITADKLDGREAPENIDWKEGWRISFHDDGIGFEQQYANKIFEPFQRLHGKMEYPGTGVGLSICKKIMQYHGGTIEATGHPGKGSRFNLYLPSA